MGTTGADEERPRHDGRASKNYSSDVHTEAGVKGLVTDSNLERLLTQLENEGKNVSAAWAELVALKNFVTHSTQLKSQALTHLQYLLSLYKQ